MKNYPMNFTVTGFASQGAQSIWSSEVPEYHRSLFLAIPPEFDGPGGGFSPEDLYALALQNCFIATFKVFAEKSKLNFLEIRIKTILTVDRNDKGQPWMAAVHLDIRLTGIEKREDASRILERVSQSCLILNSVNTRKTFDFKIE